MIGAAVIDTLELLGSDVLAEAINDELPHGWYATVDRRSDQVVIYSGDVGFCIQPAIIVGSLPELINWVNDGLMYTRILDMPNPLDLPARPSFLLN